MGVSQSESRVVPHSAFLSNRNCTSRIMKDRLKMKQVVKELPGVLRTSVDIKVYLHEKLPFSLLHKVFHLFIAPRNIGKKIEMNFLYLKSEF